MLSTLEKHVDAVGSSAYWGESGEWLLARQVHRDSDSLSRSNWAVLLQRLGGESGLVRIERFNHWAVGWIDKLLVHPCDTRRIAIVKVALAEIEDYPVLDESHWSELEWNEFWEFAESELRQFENWESAVHAALEETGGGPGDGEWEIIEAAREALESAE